jgi:hypothetical protein
MFCPDCGAVIAEGRKFCGKCGGHLHATTGTAETTQFTQASLVQAAPTTPAEPISTRAKVLYFTLAALLAVLGGGVWWWFHRPAPAYKVQDPAIYPFQGLIADGKTQKWGFIDPDGKVLIQPEWDGVAIVGVMGQPIAFNEGLCGVQKDGKWGYIDTSGHLAIPNQFDNAGAFVEGLAKVSLGNRVGYIDKTGHYAINPQFYEAHSFHGGLAVVRADGGWGVVNKSGTYVIRPHFQEMNPNGFSDGLAMVCQGTCGYIDRDGTFVIKSQFDSEGPFSEGLASVRVDNKWGYINSSGKIVINPQFDVASAFSGGFAAVDVAGNQGTIDKSGKYVLNPGQYKIQLMEGEPLRVASSDGLGLMTGDGKWVMEPSKALTGIGPIFGRVFLGNVGGQTGLVPISILGKVLAGPYTGAMLDSLAQDIQNESSAIQSIHTLGNAESSYFSAYSAKGFAASISALGPATGTPDQDHSGLIAADLATGTKDNYQFVISIPEGTSTGGINFNYFIVAKPVAGHFGRTLCADSTGAVRYAVSGQECTITSPTL